MCICRYRRTSVERCILGNLFKSTQKNSRPPTPSKRRMRALQIGRAHMVFHSIPHSDIFVFRACASRLLKQRSPGLQPTRMRKLIEHHRLTCAKNKVNSIHRNILTYWCVDEANSACYYNYCIIHTLAGSRCLHHACYAHAHMPAAIPAVEWRSDGHVSRDPMLIAF